MNRFLHEDLRPQNMVFRLDQLEEVKERARAFKETSKKLDDGRKVLHEKETIKPVITAFPKVESEFTKPLLLFVGKW